MVWLVSLIVLFVFFAILASFKAVTSLLKWFFAVVLIFFGLVFLFNTLEFGSWPIWLWVESVFYWISLAHIWGVWDSILADVIVWTLKVFWPVLLIYVGYLLLKK